RPAEMGHIRPRPPDVKGLRISLLLTGKASVFDTRALSSDARLFPRAPTRAGRPEPLVHLGAPPDAGCPGPLAPRLLDLMPAPRAACSPGRPNCMPASRAACSLRRPHPHAGAPSRLFPPAP